MPRLQKPPLRGNDIRRALREFIGNIQIELACQLGLKAQTPDFKGADLVLQIINRRLELRAIQPRQHIAFFNDIALAYGKFSQNTALKVLNDLRARRRYHRPFGAHNLVHPSKCRPKQEDQ